MSSILFEQIEICFNDYAKNQTVDFKNQDESKKFETLLFESLPTVIKEIKSKKLIESEVNWKGPHYFDD